MFKYIIISCLLFCISVDAGGRYVSDKGVVLDKISGLMWQKKTSEKKLTWKKAILYCKKLKVGKINDWRLPNVDELMSLVNKNRSFPSIDKKYFPDTKNNHYWSSSINKKDKDKAWVVFFNYGYVHHYHRGDNKASVRCVKNYKGTK